MTAMVQGQRGRGRPRTRWLDEVKEDTGLTLAKLRLVARDRMKWRALCKEVARGRPRLDEN